MIGGETINLSARLLPLIGQTKQRAHLLDRKTESAAPADKGQPLPVFFRIEAVVAL
jgi:hypothetical protein